MPVVFRQNGFRFLFYANEGSPWELIEVIEQHRDEIARAWDEFFGEG
jgi:hypothetical protein